SVTAVQVAQCLLLAVSCVVVYDISLRTLDQKIARWAGTICAIFPMLIWYTPRLWTEIFLTFMVAVYVVTLVRFLERPTRFWAFLCGLTVGLTALSKGIALIFVIITPVVFAIKFRRQAVQWTLIFLLAAMAVLAPWMRRNWQMTGRFVPVHVNAGFNFLLGNGFARNWEDMPLSYVALRQKTLDDHADLVDATRSLSDGTVADPVAQDDIYLQVALNELKNDPAFMLKKIAVQSITFWYLAADSARSVFTGIIQIPFALLGFVGMIFAVQRRSRAMILLIPIVGIMGGSVAIFSFARLSTPVMPYVIGLAVYGGMDLFRKGWLFFGYETD
ncbi:MAG: hypothetical protein GY803_07955, partial [Chloroflexi bacterium]|nr:hypothetical protein [Chloroflexota bacterium]